MCLSVCVRVCDRKGGVHGSKIPSQLQQFFSSAISIAIINFSGCKLTGEMAV